MPVRYIQNWSGGKDSTASIILEHLNGLPQSTIIFVEEMFDKRRGISGQLPEHMEWIHNAAIPTFQRWGYEVKILHADKDYLDCFYHVVHRSKNSEHNGKYYGFPIGRHCKIESAIKMKAINDFYKNIDGDVIQYVGIAADETERLERLNGTNKRSLLAQYGYTEEMAKELCKKYGLLSPWYDFGVRGGCWFCPSTPIWEFAHIKIRHPELWAELEQLSHEQNTVSQCFRYTKTFAEINAKVDDVIKNRRDHYAV